MPVRKLHVLEEPHGKSIMAEVNLSVRVVLTQYRPNSAADACLFVAFLGSLVRKLRAVDAMAGFVKLGPAGISLSDLSCHARL